MANARGFTLIEVVVALTILLVVMVGLVTMTGKTANIAAISDRQEAAMQLMNDRLDQVRADPAYDSLAARYATTETSFPTLPGLQRVTQIIRFTASSNDFKRITVTMSGGGLSAPIARTVTVAAP
jgi:prepilin-type N-terminal cleavage/methylation domain-containing protein